MTSFGKELHWTCTVFLPYIPSIMSKGNTLHTHARIKNLALMLTLALKRADIPKYSIEDGTNPDGEIIALPYLADVCVFVYRRSVAREVLVRMIPTELARSSCRHPKVG
jgi:hypothetical protein